MIRVRRATSETLPAWLRMRDALWPHHESGSHAGEVEQYFAGKLRMPLEVLLAFDENGAAVGFVELSIRSYAEDCETDRVAYLEGWYVAPEFRCAALVARSLQRPKRGGSDRDAPSSAPTRSSTNELSAVAHRGLGFEETVRIRCFKKVLPRESSRRTSPSDPLARRYLPSFT